MFSATCCILQQKCSVNFEDWVSGNRIAGSHVVKFDMPTDPLNKGEMNVDTAQNSYMFVGGGGHLPSVGTCE